jgi:hypothetical protein
MIYTWNVQIDSLFHLPFSDLWSDQYSSSRCEIKPKITPKSPGFHHDSMTIGPIANRRAGDERGRETAYFTYRLYHDTIRTQILNLSKKCWVLGSRFCVETGCNGPVPGRNQIRNLTAHLDPLLSLDVPQAISNISTMCTRSVRRVTQLDTSMNMAWRLSFRLVRQPHWPLFLWQIWNHSLRFC